jgi:hypothetical protein
MAYEQLQWACNRCGKATLHARTKPDVPHVLYLLLTVFCCGLALPIWLLHSIVAGFSKGPPFLCQECGQTAGQRTPEQEAAWHAALQRDKAFLSQQAAAARAARAAGFSAAMSRATEYTRTATVSLVAGVKNLPGQTNRLLQVVAGEENTIVYRFLQVAVLSLMLATFSLLLIAICATLARVILG